MAIFVTIQVESDCCQSYGICGEQYSQDVIFDDTGRVTTSRFRFQHTVQKTQEDYIKGLVETRKACDQYAPQLTTYSDANLNPDESAIKLEIDHPEPQSYAKMFTDYLGITQP